jgi:hypothetical protein
MFGVVVNHTTARNDPRGLDSRSKGGMDHGISPLKLTQLADEAGFSNSP